MIPKIEWPEGKQFAFTIFDDPDLDTIENVQAIYPFLADLGLRTTKAVWPIRGTGRPYLGGATCEEEKYLKLMLDLHGKGFEIALHNATYHTSTREQTILGLENFRQHFGHYPYTMANHSGCRESMYWGNTRVSGSQRLAYDLLSRIKLHGRTFSEGHVETSPLFWGDLCRDKIKYIRNFVLGDINTLKACPIMPYYDPARPYGNSWFAASEGPSVKAFNRLISEGNQDKLAGEGGACIVYAHLASGFIEDGRFHRRFKFLMERLSRLNGWFVPVRTLLDFIVQQRGVHCITEEERTALERKWLWHKIFHTGGRS